MFTRTAAAKIPASDDDRILAVQLPFLDEASRIKGFRKAAHGIRTEFLVFLRNGWNQSQVLSRNNLVGIDVVFDHVSRPCKNRLHGKQPGANTAFVQLEIPVQYSRRRQETLIS